MKFLIDFFPIALFFVAYKFWGIYVATGVAIAASVVQVSYEWVRHRKVDKMQWMTLGLIVVLGGATLLLHNELFIKWKPTVINWLFAAVFWGSQYIGKEPVIRRMMQKQIQLSPTVWKRLNISWVLFFFITGWLNLYVVYHYDTNIWVDFKLFGVMGLTFVFVIIQAIFLAKHLKVSRE